MSDPLSMSTPYLTWMSATNGKLLAYISFRIVGPQAGVLFVRLIRNATCKMFFLLRCSIKPAADNEASNTFTS